MEIQQLRIPHVNSRCNEYLSVSIGVSICDLQHACEVKEYPINLADKALYNAKESGRNQTVLG